MPRLFVRFLPIAALLLVVSACGGDDSNDTPTTPPPVDVTEPFQGVIALNGAFTHPFTVTNPGVITAQLVSLSPDPTLVVGLALGTWNGSICQIVRANDQTKQGDVVDGATNTAGQFCVRIYDANGTIVQAQAYLIHVFHQ
jgi:hypothetical protein